jgi:uncharacterized membrane protein YvbJ
MALIDCPECGYRVSDKADSCPQCGYKINEYKKYEEPYVRESNHVTIERTKKTFKFQGVLSTLIFIIGLLLLCSKEARTIGVWFICIGLGWNIINGIRVWWHHG